MSLRKIVVPVALLLASVSTPAVAQIAFNPQAGLSASRLSTDPPDTEGQARLGYQIGATLRIGGRLHLMPGVFWQRSGTQLRMRPTFQDPFNDGEIADITRQTDLSAAMVSLGFGYNVIHESIFKVRVHASAAATSIYEVDSEDSRLSKDNFKTLLLGVPIGAGVDILNLITVDLSYETGVTDLFEDYLGIPIDATNNVFRFNVGVVF
ncbi:MAG: outer membrane beta-barrel protein [Rhodothermales bacterium]